MDEMSASAKPHRRLVLLLGVGAPTVRDLAGHEHMHVTARYALSDDASIRAAIAQLGKLAS